MTIGACINIGSGDARTHPRGVPFRSYNEMADGIGSLIRDKKYTKAVAWMPVGREPPYNDDGTGGTLCFDGIFSVVDTGCEWMRETDLFGDCWTSIRSAGLKEMWWYAGNLYDGRPGFVTMDKSAWRLFAARAKRMIELARSAMFTGIVIDAAGDAGPYSREYELARMIRDSGLRVGHEGWAKDTAPHWKDEASHHGFLMPYWWPQRAMYGRKPVGGRSVLNLIGEKAERVRVAREILAEGDGVYDDVWNGLTPADLEVTV